MPSRLAPSGVVFLVRVPVRPVSLRARAAPRYTGVVMPGKNDLPTRPVGRLNLNFGLWLVTHRRILKRVWVGVLVAASIGLYGASLIIVVGLVRGQAAYREMMNALTEDLIDYPTLRRLMAPKPLQLSPPQVLPAGGDRVDWSVRVTNPNRQFRVSPLVLKFFDGGERADGAKEVGTVQSFLLPGESRYVVRFGSPRPAGNLQAQLATVGWQRVNLQRYAEIRAERLQFEVLDVTHRRGDELGTVGRLIAGQTSFTVANRSLLGVWDVGVYVFLMNGDQLVAANYAHLRRLDPQTRQALTVSWPQALPLTTAVTVVPEVDPFDPGVFYRSRPPATAPR